MGTEAHKVAHPQGITVKRKINTVKGKQQTKPHHKADRQIDGSSHREMWKTRGRGMIGNQCGWDRVNKGQSGER